MRTTLIPGSDLSVASLTRNILRMVVKYGSGDKEPFKQGFRPIPSILNQIACCEVMPILDCLV